MKLWQTLISINSKIIEENQNDQFKKCSIFEGLVGGNKQMFITFMVYDSAI